MPAPDASHIRIRRARLDEAGTLAPRLTALCRRSKAHWGYPGELLERWADDLRIEPTDIDRDVVLLAETTGDARPDGPRTDGPRTDGSRSRPDPTEPSGPTLLGFARVGVDPETAGSASADMGGDGSSGASPRVARLHDLWVEPAAMGQGVGRALMTAAIEVARTLPAERLRIISDPNAEPFYERFGAQRMGEADSEVVAGRRLPILELALGPARIAPDPREPG